MTENSLTKSSIWQKNGNPQPIRGGNCRYLSGRKTIYISTVPLRLPAKLCSQKMLPDRKFSFWIDCDTFFSSFFLSLRQFFALPVEKDLLRADFAGVCCSTLSYFSSVVTSLTD